MTAKLGRREQKKIDNRKAICDAGLEVFASIGYERATISDIVSASGLSVGSFYNYYGDKDSVFSELIEQFLIEVRATLNQARQSATCLESFVRGAFRSYGELISAHPKMQKLISKNSDAFRRFVTSEQELAGIVADLEKDMQSAIDSGLSPFFPVKLMTAVMIAASVELFSGGYEAYTDQERATFLGSLFLGGIERIAATK